MVGSVVQYKLNTHVAVWSFVPHSGQKRALISTVAEHCGQNRSGRGSFVPQSWQNFPGGPMRRQVGHITAWGKPGVLKPAISARVRTCCCAGDTCGGGGGGVENWGKAWGKALVLDFVALVWCLVLFCRSFVFVPCV